MHVTTKDVDKDGTHILTSVIEGDGALAIVSAEGQIEAKVISVSRTDAGGIKVQTAVTVTEPAPAVAPTPLTPTEEAVAYLVGKGQGFEAAQANVAKFGFTRVLAAQAAEQAHAEKSLDQQLADLLATPAPETPTVQ